MFILKVVIVLESLVFFTIKKISNDVGLCIFSIIVLMPVSELCTGIRICKQSRYNIANRHSLHC
ncbi:hypothetical protein BD408DRAFT_427233 [Parasitella parasitica]|nr:hypothetical protein BD408DRAFT_427233 [Parasitella parasitica]